MLSNNNKDSTESAPKSIQDDSRQCFQGLKAALRLSFSKEAMNKPWDGSNV